jgi:hypothetical protein
MHQKILFLVCGTLSLLGATLLLKVSDPIRAQFLSGTSPNCRVSIASVQTPEQQKVDYSELCNLLTAQKFEAANLQTEKLLLQLANLNPDDYLTSKDIRALPCEDLKTINQLWLEHSNHHFGLTIQKEIWLALGNQLGTENLVEHDRFAQAVGWTDGSRTRLLTEEDFGFNPNQAKGHLPILPKAATLYSAAHLISRAKVCSI